MQKALKKYAAFFTLPTLLAFAVAFLAPFLIGIYLSFTKFSTITDAQWVGFGNYAKAFEQGGDFLHSLGFTACFAAITIVSINGIAFLFALMLTRKLRGTNFFRTVFFMPNLIGGIVLGYIWQLILNGVLYHVGQTVISDATYGFWGLVVLVNWQMIGYMMVIYIAGIQNVPQDLLDAAAVDGASSGQVLRHVTIPMVMPSITICLFLTLTNSFRLFDQNLALTGGQPGKDSAMLALNIYQTFYGTPGYEGVGQAKAVVFFLLVAGIALLQLRLTKRKEVEA
ncbi:MAG: sugar ABC transporter permease [Oscillospiraceae bacterium]|jgi:raffinose/stachyose/melibiose transport system permease protein|nr:sugar ABC transporter permease [Oscillospiraceae bacterium]MCI1989803.1 sugar ABC transporter permease [Oscillospiraceae bacterium]MCI2034406.1 sugar ABC transporter permease [Oscillospiraceae bacterium]